MRGINEITQFARQSDGKWTWFCPGCNQWGAHERLSFAYTDAETHKKVTHP